MILFVVAGLLSIAGAVGVVLARQPVHQVLATVLNFIGLAGLYAGLSAEFMAVIQIVIYGGAVMVLFLFVIALLSARKDPLEKHDLLSRNRVVGYALGGAMLLMLLLVGIIGLEGNASVATLAEGFGTVGNFGLDLTTIHVLPFELTAFILMVAVIGVVILVGRQQS